MSPTKIIEPPTEDIPAGPIATNAQLLELQKRDFGKNKKQATTPLPAEKVEEPTDDTPPTDRAAEIFKRNQDTNKRLAEEPGGEEDEDAEVPEGFKPISTFIKLEEEKKGEKKEEPKKEEPPVLDADKETNLKNLRGIANDFKKKHNDAQARITELETQLQAKQPSSALETENLKLKERVQNLEQYELVFGLHDNPDFKREILDQQTSLIEEMTEIATDYGVDESVVEQILSARNRKELDDVLSDNFESAHPQNDLKALRQKYVGVSAERARKEAKPGETLAEYNQRKEEMELENNRRRDTNLTQVVSEGWKLAKQAVLELPEEQKIYELIEIPGQKEHNENVVKPTLQHAGNLTNHIISHVEDLIRKKALPSRAFVAWVAQLMQQAAATQMLRDSRKGIYDKLTKLEAEQSQQSSYDRPNLNGSPRTPADKNGKAKTTEERLAQTFINVVSRGDKGI